MALDNAAATISHTPLSKFYLLRVCFSEYLAILIKEEVYMPKNYVCVAKFIKTNEAGSESYLVKFPNLNGCLCDGKTIQEAMERALEACAGWMLFSDEIPKPDLSLLEASNQSKDEFYNLLYVDLEEYSKKISVKSVKKNVTLPSWLNERAEKENLNFSQILQKGIKGELGIAE